MRGDLTFFMTGTFTEAIVPFAMEKMPYDYRKDLVPIAEVARLPFVLMNGASGIAVGMATEIPPHNLREVAEAAKLLIRKPEAVLEEVLTVLPAPDFPGGGQLISTPADIREAYASGRGSLRMRARWKPNRA